jgi:hypothetical protein
MRRRNDEFLTLPLFAEEQEPMSDEDQFELIVEGVDEQFEHDGRRLSSASPSRCSFGFISNSSEELGIFRELQIRPTRCGTP